MGTGTVAARDVARGMTIIAVNGTPVSPPVLVGHVRQAFAVPWARRRYDVWSDSGWPGGPPVMTVAAGDRVTVETAV